jgi:serine/threonine protein kinase
MTERPSWIGKTLGGRYRIDEIVGQGGMSAVYKAYDPNLRRVVAIKLIHSHLADDPRFVTRFEEEAAAVAQLRHPNIVQVYDFTHDGDLYYMVQEFLPGETLQDRLRRLTKNGRQLSINEGAGFILDICEASGYAHRRGMVHRDIKPANIMINVQNQAILMDFGIVKITGGDSHTATGAVVGTALYLAPEIIRGETADPRSDIYSLGVALFEVLGGKPPFQSDSAMTLMMMHLNDPVPDLRQLRPDIPADLVRVVERALGKNRQDRFQSMEEMAAEIRAALADKPAQQPDGKTVMDVTPGIVPGVVGAPPPADRTVIADPSLKEDAAISSAEVSQHDALSRDSAGSTSDQQAEGRTVIEHAPHPSQTGTGSAAVIPTEMHSGAMPPTRTPTAGVDGAGIESVYPLAQSPHQAAQKPNRLYFWIGSAGILIIILIAVIVILSRFGSGGGPPLSSADEGLPARPTAQEEAGLLPAEETPTPTATVTATVQPSPTATSTPTPTATLGLPPTPTFPAGVPFSYINNITIDDLGRYVVEYDTLEFVEELPGVHIHFFFNSVLPEQAGNPGSGPWILYGGP